MRAAHRGSAPESSSPTPAYPATRRGATSYSSSSRPPFRRSRRSGTSVPSVGPGFYSATSRAGFAARTSSGRRQQSAPSLTTGSRGGRRPPASARLPLRSTTAPRPSSTRLDTARGCWARSRSAGGKRICSSGWPGCTRSGATSTRGAISSARRAGSTTSSAIGWRSPMAAARSWETSSFWQATPRLLSRALRASCQQLEGMHEQAVLASRAAELAEAIYLQDRLDEAERSDLRCRCACRTRRRRGSAPAARRPCEDPRSAGLARPSGGCCAGRCSPGRADRRTELPRQSPARPGGGTSARWERPGGQGVDGIGARLPRAEGQPRRGRSSARPPGRRGRSAVRRRAQSRALRVRRSCAPA